MAEGARLESVYTGNRIVGSNPTLSAKSDCCNRTTKPPDRPGFVASFSSYEPRAGVRAATVFAAASWTRMEAAIGGYPLRTAHRSFSLCGSAAARRSGSSRKMKNPPGFPGGCGGFGDISVVTQLVTLH